MKLYDYLNELRCVIPEEMQEEWDNTGIQVNTGDKDIKKVLAALEITADVIEEAIDKSADMIVTHHPLIFGGTKSINSENALGRYLIKLIKEDIAVYSCHTNFDKLPGGNNDTLCKLMGLTDVEYIAGDDITRMGECRPQTLREFAEKLAEALDADIEEFHIVGNPDEVIEKVGCCTGAGSEYLEIAKVCGCDLFVTGDLKHHEARTAEEAGICVIDAGHYGTEKIFPKAFIDIMKANDFDDEIEFIESECCRSPWIKL